MPNVDAFLGLRGTSDFVTGQVPGNWREGVLYYEPNGDAPLVALTALMESSKIDSYTRSWWQQGIPTQSVNITGIFDDNGLAVAYTAAADASGLSIFLKMAAADVALFRPGNHILLRKTADFRYDIRVKVIATQANGASSYLACTTLETASATYGINGVDMALRMANLNAQGAPRPVAMAWRPTKFTNNTSIIRTPLELARTVRQTHTRTGDPYKKAKRDAAFDHATSLEWAYWHSQLYEGIGDNGKPETAMRGLIPAIITYAPGNTDDFRYNTDYSGASWLASGMDWMNTMFEQIFRYGRDEKLAFCGSGTLKAINDLAETYGTINLETRDMAWGIKVREWIHSAGTLYLKKHPLWSLDDSHRYSMAIIEPERLEYNFIQDTIFLNQENQQQAREMGYDATMEEFLTECTLTFDTMEAFGYLNGFGKANIV